MVVKSEQKLDEYGENAGTTLLGGEYWKMANSINLYTY